MPRTPKYTDPIRFPQYADRSTRDVRGWILLVSTILLPGSVQSLFGVRRFARFALGLSLATWALVVLVGLAALLRRQLVFTLATNPLVLGLLTLWALVLGVVWLVALVDTVRRIRLVGLSPRTCLGVVAAALVSVLVIGGGLAWGTVTLNSQRQLISEIFAGGLGVRPSDGRYNVALLGTDAGKGREGIRPDSISLVSIDADTGESVIIGLPRNLQNVPFAEDSPLRSQYPQGYDCGDECLINAVYQLGEQHPEGFDDGSPAGAQAMKDAISGATGVDVHYYAMIDLKGFESLIDAMGGISLVSGKRVPISAPVDKATGKHGPVRGWIEPGELHLDGFHALWYARSREFASDYERMVRQRCVQEAMIAQLDPATVLTRYQSIAQAAPEVVSTDIPQLQVDRFVDLALKAKSQKIRSLNLTPPEVVPADPDYAAVHALVAEALEPAEARAASPDEPAVLAAGAAPAGLDPVAGAVPGAVLAAAPTEGGEDEKDRAICYVP
ncbi:LCP family protein [Nocardia zapadnayensis]|uniref:LCP family protein n=1 Tax=Brevibacterium sp. R8603A2 TaxID=2929779 RepID=UPI001FFA1CCB|nr:MULTISPECIES: LCP family protein [Actinomycetes]MCK1803821.1 LCP family protein [Brevibacterium sp. R8603A2]MCX0278027.1 LCP family protein [Nocardia zapadnayensis]